MAKEKKAVERASRPAAGLGAVTSSSGLTSASATSSYSRLSVMPSLRRSADAPLSVPRRSMANIASQKKRNARSLRERDENRRLTSAVKTHFRRLEAAVRPGDGAAADAEHKQLVSRIDTAVQRGALHPNNGARKKARAARTRAGAGS